MGYCAEASMIRWRTATYMIAGTAIAAIAATAACGSGSGSGFGGSSSGSSSSGGGSTGSSGSGGSSSGTLFGDSGLPGDAGGLGDAFTLPSNFVHTELGGYALGAPIPAGGLDAGLVTNGAPGNCSLIVGVVRDFLGSNLQPMNGGMPHPDFEAFWGNSPTLGLVQNAIGGDRKPVYASRCDIASGFSDTTICPYGQQMTTKANFDQWYRNTPGINLPYLVYMEFVPNAGVFTFRSDTYFPLDNAGFGNTPGWPHNFSFTTELHLRFQYMGGETFSFTGDDDLWVFINGQLAIDLGGLHHASNGSVSLDTMGLTKGQEYDLELFNAERHTDKSDFRADTNLAFTNCGTIPPQ
jgi:fibro-slime domain-containing protein